MSDGGLYAGEGPDEGANPLQRASGGLCRCGCGMPLVGKQTMWRYEAHRWKAWDQKYPRPIPSRQRPLPFIPASEFLIQPRDQRVRARRRAFSAQAQRILARLEAGPVANVELALMFPPATAWRSRLSDVRWELRRRLGLVKEDQDPIPGYDCGGGIVWHWLGEVR